MAEKTTDLVIWHLDFKLGRAKGWPAHNSLVGDQRPLPWPQSIVGQPHCATHNSFVRVYLTRVSSAGCVFVQASCVCRSPLFCDPDTRLALRPFCVVWGRSCVCSLAQVRDGVCERLAIREQRIVVFSRCLLRIQAPEACCSLGLHPLRRG